ncbi:tRNA1(Val) (adenine(37)-N6)-methyltransferase [Tissierella pigra]|uniref:tRNA1(Val) (Adenine(37)-N6)-methyltransferase n=1 Tax=Tissierella pigra TaxID=2607614 RepID=A0A6N7XVN5_9FIRM|nr:tRNA1(Val) (adenine(37)-N6)-methyltransferase [Tissierella pigra]MBU5427992.1 tRNA1(Val) (adenine(37)-N6)-methyltransferase [Tissierella pigra]MSU00555.1 tRNA1(Val) (adenine(37)-N6)-methyltransferase [Tissierella pigra]
MLKEKERIDIVPGTNFKIIQNKERFSYGTDAIFLSNFAKGKGIVVDLGTGTGIIPLRIYGKDKVDIIYGVEIQNEVAEMANRSIELNKLEENIKILNMDLKDLPNIFSKNTVDIVTSNPPYMKSGGALVNHDENFAISRHELACNLRDIIEVTEYLLKPLGKFYMVHRPDRLVDIIYLLREYKLEPKYIRFVQPKLNKKPNLILIEAVKGGKPDLKFYDPLIVYNDDGSYTEEITTIYGTEYQK